MTRLNHLSIGLTVAGLAAVVLGLLLDLSPTVVLVGLMLVVAGAVKVATVVIWRAIVDADVPAPPGR